MTGKDFAARFEYVEILWSSRILTLCSGCRVHSQHLQAARYSSSALSLAFENFRAIAIEAFLGSFVSHFCVDFTLLMSFPREYRSVLRSLTSACRLALSIVNLTRPFKSSFRFIDLLAVMMATRSSFAA